MRSYYGRRTPGQMKGVVTRPVVGVDEYSHPTAANDNYLSDMIDAYPLNNEATVLDVEQTVDGGFFDLSDNTEGAIYEAIATNRDNKYALLTQEKRSGLWNVKIADTLLGSVIPLKVINTEYPGGNIVNDGHFEDFNSLLGPDTAGVHTWNIENATNVYYKDRTCYFTATATNGGIRQSIDWYPNSKIYVRTDRQYFRVVVTIDTGSGFTTTTYYIAPTFPPQVYHHNVISIGGNPTDTVTVRIDIIDERASAWTERSISEVIMLDVTHETELTDEQIKTKYRAIGYIASGSAIAGIYSSARFSTEDKKYVCFTSSLSKKLLFVDIDKAVNLEYPSNFLDLPVNLPFYPKKIVTIHNRIFAIDTGNKIWWCRAGDFFSWYSMEYVDNSIVTLTNMINGAYTIAAQPDITRPITATVQMRAGADTLGTIEIVGTNELDQVISEVIVPTYGRVQTLKSFKTVTSITGSGWTASGTADVIVFGTAPASGGFVQNDAGFWTIERESSLSDICVLSNNLYIYAPDNIYVFRGYSPDTFSLNQIITNIGIPTYQSQRIMQTTVGNISYFISNKNVYQFNGYDYPRLISHKEMTNGAVTNGIFGGIKELDLSIPYSIASDKDNIYIYDSREQALTDNPIYIYNIDAKTWWIRSGFNINNSVYSEDTFKVLYVTTIDTQSVVSFVSALIDITPEPEPPVG